MVENVTFPSEKVIHVYVYINIFMLLVKHDKIN